MGKVSVPPKKQTGNNARLREWLARLDALMTQVTKWSESKGWEVQRQETEIEEKSLGVYTAPALRIQSKEDHLMRTPVALHVIGGNSRVDLEAYPSFSRVKLIAVPDGWQIWTDSNVPLRVPWNRRTFIQLAEDLLG